MEEKGQLLKVGKYDSKFNEILGIDIKDLEIYRSKGLPVHMVKRKHFKCLKLIVMSTIILRSEMVPDTLVRVPEMLDTPPSQNNCAFIIYFIKY